MSFPVLGSSASGSRSLGLGSKPEGIASFLESATSDRLGSVSLLRLRPPPSVGDLLGQDGSAVGFSNDGRYETKRARHPTDKKNS
ncbi:hypothetical protein DID80_05205 [Candidatus Marinamargulisbacteria bacterium SCGC AAA071-K20]|nr:hypothetical protein DID80_05205 [Candidatus Marinamargulisbacteria bacterium SCGC AAA071-K20]